MRTHTFGRVLVCLATTLVLTGGLAGTAQAGTAPAADRSASAGAALTGAVSTISVKATMAQEWSVPHKRLYRHPWYVGGGACYGESVARVIWDDDGNRHLDVNSRAKSTSVGGGCRARVRFTLNLRYWTEEGPVDLPHQTHVYDIDTACSTTDPTPGCSSVRHHYFRYDLGPEEELVSVSSYDVEDRRT